MEREQLAAAESASEAALAGAVADHERALAVQSAADDEVLHAASPAAAALAEAHAAAAARLAAESAAKVEALAAAHAAAASAHGRAVSALRAERSAAQTTRTAQHWQSIVEEMQREVRVLGDRVPPLVNSMEQVFSDQLESVQSVESLQQRVQELEHAQQWQPVFSDEQAPVPVESWREAAEDMQAQLQGQSRLLSLRVPPLVQSMEQVLADQLRHIQALEGLQARAIRLAPVIYGESV